jgi:hypothetical protein
MMLSSHQHLHIHGLEGPWRRGCFIHAVEIILRVLSYSESDLTNLLLDHQPCHVSLALLKQFPFLVYLTKWDHPWLSSELESLPLTPHEDYSVEQYNTTPRHGESFRSHDEWIRCVCLESPIPARKLFYLSMTRLRTFMVSVRTPYNSEQSSGSSFSSVSASIWQAFSHFSVHDFFFLMQLLLLPQVDMIIVLFLVGAQKREQTTFTERKVEHKASLDSVVKNGCADGLRNISIALPNNRSTRSSFEIKQHAVQMTDQLCCRSWLFVWCDRCESRGLPWRTPGDNCYNRSRRQPCSRKTLMSIIKYL